MGTTLNGCDKSLTVCEPVVSGSAASEASFLDASFGELVDSIAAPWFLVIDGDTVGYLELNGAGYTAFADQPSIPAATTGSYKHMAMGTDNVLYVIFEEDTPAQTQWFIAGRNPLDLIPWTGEVGVKFTPRSLNLGSNGKWVTCKIDEFGYDWTAMDLSDLCIIGINDKLFSEPLCVDTNGPSNTKNSNKMMAKFDRRALASEITAEIAAELAANPDFDPTQTKITLAFSDGTVNVYWEDTIKTKPAKNKKPK